MATDLSLVNDFSKRCGQASAAHRAIDFMIAYLSYIKAPLPEIVRKGLGIAKQYRTGLVNADEMVQARVGCWEFLKDHHATTDFSTPKYCIVRAVICVLDERPKSIDTVC